MSKKALIVGLSYKNAYKNVSLPSTLIESKITPGCITSTKQLRNIVIHYFRFPSENITYISDEDREDTPTDREILDELCKMVKGAQSGDILLFVFAGHGGSYECKYNNNSARVEFIVAGERNGTVRPITNDTIREIVETVPLESSFTMISDSCNSGALVGGAYEQMGYSTRKFVNDRGKAPCNMYLQRMQLLNAPSGRRLGIFKSSCQNYETSTHNSCASNEA